MGSSNKSPQNSIVNPPKPIYANELSISYKRCKLLMQPEYHSLNSSKKIAELLRRIWNTHDLAVRESFYLLCFSQRLDLIGFYRLSDGGLHCIAVDHRLLFAAALLCRASSIIIAHNHPSGFIIS